MINPFEVFRRPEYFYRPSQVARRLQRIFTGPPPARAAVRLPWGETIQIHPHETIGTGIWHYGVFDLIVTEAICRLLDAGETALDIGANMGQMTSLMRHRAGPAGRVHSFEPHPQLFAELSALVQPTIRREDAAPVELHQLALSDQAGEACFDMGADWAENRGLGKVVAGAPAPGGQKLTVRLGVLDEILSPKVQIGVCKIDVEGHELQVFRGATRLFRERRIRDLIFEDFGKYPSAVHQFLLEQGCTIFALHSSLWRPRLVPVGDGTRSFKVCDGENYLATFDPERARARFQSAGWRVLR